MNISKRSLNSCVLALILLLGVGCARKLDDAKMSSDIQNKFSQDSGLASKQLTVQANNGVVTLQAPWKTRHSGTPPRSKRRQFLA